MNNREAFEACIVNFKSNVILKRFENGNYVSAVTENYFNIWQLALSSQSQQPLTTCTSSCEHSLACTVAQAQQKPMSLKIRLNSLAESARCLGVAQAKNDKDAIEHLTNVVDELVLSGSSQAQQEPINQWISVEEQLPDADDYVFVYMPNNNYLKVGIDCWQMQKERPLSFSSQTVDIGMGWDDNEFEDVSHWMAIPPAPIECNEKPEGDKP